MTGPQSEPSTLFDLLVPIPAGKTAIILPEQNIKLSYGQLRDRVIALAEALAAAGVKRGDRVGMALPNGLPMIVSFLAASMAGIQRGRISILPGRHQRPRADSPANWGGRRA